MKVLLHTRADANDDQCCPDGKFGVTRGARRRRSKKKEDRLNSGVEKALLYLHSAELQCCPEREIGGAKGVGKRRSKKKEGIA
jgi:hypothetical protein